MRRSGSNPFDASVYSSPEATAAFHDIIRELSQRSSVAKPTPFHQFLDRLARSGHLLRHYTQNIDFIERYMFDLRQKTVQLHGRIDEAICQYCNWSGPLLPDQFIGPDAPTCPKCEGVAFERVRNGKRRSGVGCIRPNILLYGEDNRDSVKTGRIAAKDLRKAPDMLIVTGTSLKVPGAKRLVKEFCRATKACGGTTVWINTEAAPSGLNTAFDFVIRATCDNAASSF